MTIDGKFHYGLLTHLKEKNGLTKEGYYISNSVGMPFAYQVRPETICQFTGFRDRKMVQIFEFDIVEFDRHEWGGDNNIHIVTWDNKEGEWDWGGGVTSDMNFRSVIGNVFSNPELLLSAEQKTIYSSLIKKSSI